MQFDMLLVAPKSGSMNAGMLVLLDSVYQHLSIEDESQVLSQK